jgi:hypothetical protein
VISANLGNIVLTLSEYPPFPKSSGCIEAVFPWTPSSCIPASWAVYKSGIRSLFKVTTWEASASAPVPCNLPWCSPIIVNPSLGPFIYTSEPLPIVLSISSYNSEIS